jgi:hypothetical protein
MHAPIKINGEQASSSKARTRFFPKLSCIAANCGSPPSSSLDVLSWNSSAPSNLSTRLSAMATASREGVVSNFNFDGRLQLRECLHGLLQKTQGLGRWEDEQGAAAAAAAAEDEGVGGGTGRMSRAAAAGRASMPPLLGREGWNHGRQRSYLPMLPKMQRAHWEDEQGPHLLLPPLQAAAARKGGEAGTMAAAADCRCRRRRRRPAGGDLRVHLIKSAASWLWPI